MPDLYENIRARREELGMTQDELAAKMGYKSRSSINKIEMGVNDIPQSKIKAFAAALSTTTYKLMGEDEGDQKLPANAIPLKRVRGLRQVPLLGRIACGEPILAEENIEDYIILPSRVKADFALKAKGDSMIDAHIMDGDYLYIKQQDDVDNGEIAAVLIGNDATLKRVRKYEDHIILAPENSNYPAKRYWREEMNQVRILGKLTAVLSVRG